MARRRKPQRRNPAIARRNGFIQEPWDLAENNGFTVHGGFTSHRDPLITILFVSKKGERGLTVIRSVKDRYGTATAVEGEFIPEGWDYPEVEEWARLNSGSKQLRIDRLRLTAAGFLLITALIAVGGQGPPPHPELVV